MNLEVLCVSMKQKDFSLVEKMHCVSNMVISNQSDTTSYNEILHNGNKIKMITTQTRGVGVNRNIGLLYATGDICLLADDDVVFRHGYENEIIQEFLKHPNADVIIFNLGTTTPEFGRKPTVTKKYKKMHLWSKNPYGGPRIAFRLNSIKKSNIAFSTCFGGGAIFASGEDSLWINQILKNRLRVYLSPRFIGDVSYSNSTWFSDDVKKICYGRGAYIEAHSRVLAPALILYYTLFRKPKNISSLEAYRWLNNGRKGYRSLCPYDRFIVNEG